MHNDAIFFIFGIGKNSRGYFGRSYIGILASFEDALTIVIIHISELLYVRYCCLYRYWTSGVLEIDRIAFFDFVPRSAFVHISASLDSLFSGEDFRNQSPRFFHDSEMIHDYFIIFL